MHAVLGKFCVRSETEHSTAETLCVYARKFVAVIVILSASCLCKSILMSVGIHVRRLSFVWLVPVSIPRFVDRFANVNVAKW